MTMNIQITDLDEKKDVNLGFSPSLLIFICEDVVYFYFNHIFRQATVLMPNFSTWNYLNDRLVCLSQAQGLISMNRIGEEDSLVFLTSFASLSIESDP